MRDHGFGRVFAEDLHEATSRAQQQDEGRISVYVYCRSGKHRAPAVTEILAILGAQIDGIRIFKVHLNQPEWVGNRPNDCGGRCREMPARTLVPKIPTSNAE